MSTQSASLLGKRSSPWGARVWANALRECVLAACAKPVHVLPAASVPVQSRCWIGMAELGRRRATRLGSGMSLQGRAQHRPPMWVNAMLAEQPGCFCFLTSVRASEIPFKPLRFPSDGGEKTLDFTRGCGKFALPCLALPCLALPCLALP